MKLLCINTKPIRFDGGTENGKHIIYEAQATKLKEGEIYETRGKAYISDVYNKPVYFYYIAGLGAKLACRFTEMLENSFISKQSLEEINQN